MKVVFFGSSPFSLPALQRIHQEKTLQIVAIVTQPDKPQGRGRHVAMTPVKTLAQTLGYDHCILQPTSVSKNPAFTDAIRQYNTDIGVVVSYGKLLPLSLIHTPRYDMVNIHASLLPKYRGASPIATAIMHGETHTGITLMKIDATLDTGDILVQKKIPIDPLDTLETLSEKLARLGADMLIQLLSDDQKYASVAAHPQNHEHASFTEKIDKQNCVIDWSLPSEKIMHFVHALSPKPVAFTTYKGKTLRIYHVSPYSLVSNNVSDATYGDILCTVKNKGIVVRTGDGVLLIDDVQPENKRRMTGQAFLCGIGQNCTGQCLGEAHE